MSTKRISILDKETPARGVTHIRAQAGERTFFLAFEEHVAFGDILRVICDESTGEVEWDFRESVFSLPKELLHMRPSQGAKISLQDFHKALHEDYTGPVVHRNPISKFYVILPVKEFENVAKMRPPVIKSGYRAFRDKISATLEITGKVDVLRVIAAKGDFPTITAKDEDGSFYTTGPLEVDFGVV
jgi:hypothetical protein